MKRAFKYKLDPNRAVEARLDETLAVCRELYNSALAERRNAYRATGKGVGFSAQSRQLPEIKAVREDVAAVHSQVLQDVLWRVDAAFGRFFEGLTRGRRARYPRFRGAGRYRSFTYPQSGFALDSDRLTLSKIGQVRLWVSRPLEGTVKTLTITHEADGWYAVFTCELPTPDPLAPTGRVLGIDVNVENFLTDSDGATVENPRFFRSSEKKLAAAQRKLARKQKGSKRRARARTRVARLHQTIARQRLDFAHKTALGLVRACDVIFFERLKIANMVRNPHLAKSISDVAWGQFLGVLQAKAESAGRVARNVDPRGTTQQCSGCGEVVPKGLSVRWHSCGHCGLELNRDENSARNICERGMAVLASAAGQAVAARGGPRGSVKREPARALGLMGCLGSPHTTFEPVLPRVFPPS
jgi:putative transposase